MAEKARVAEYKKERVKELEALLQKYPIIGIVNMESLPAGSLGKLKKGLRGKAVLFMTKRRLMNIAIENVKGKVPKIENIKEQLKGMPALLFTEENPFSLYKFLKKSKSPAPAREGQEAPRDITVQKGPTPFSPGPVISEFAALGIKAGVEGGKVAVKSDTVVIRQGEKFKANLASMLARLGIMPMEIGLNVVSVWEKGVLYDRNVLDIDDKQFMSNLMTAASESLNLSVEAVFVTVDNRDLLLGKAFKDSKAVAKEAKFLADAVAEEIVEDAHREALSVAAEAKIEVSTEVGKSVEAPKVEEKPKEEPKKEEKPAEAPTPAPKVEEKKEEPKKEEKKPEPAKEEKKEEPKAEEKPAEPEKKEEKKEEPKKEEKPKEEEPEKKEEPKKEEKPAEEKEEKKEEPKEKPKEGSKSTIENLKENIDKKEKPKEAKPSVPSTPETRKQAEDLLEKLKKKGTLR